VANLRGFVLYGKFENRLLGPGLFDERVCRFFNRTMPTLENSAPSWGPAPRSEIVSQGELRKRDVKVGGHVAISAGSVPRFLGRFEDVYGHLG